MEISSKRPAPGGATVDGALVSAEVPPESTACEPGAAHPRTASRATGMNFMANGHRVDAHAQAGRSAFQRGVRASALAFIALIVDFDGPFTEWEALSKRP
jgi:hypothetical protein